MPDDVLLDSPDALRPERLDEFAGQEAITGELQIVLSAAQVRGELPDHMMFAGPPGLGKTTLANIVAAECGCGFVATSGPALDKPAQLMSLLSTLNRPTVVFIDEIHRLPAAVEELLYPAMEDGVIDVIVGQGAAARPVRLPLQPFVLVAATTEAGKIGKPLRDRFGYVGHLELYDTNTLAGIVDRSAGLLGWEIDRDAAAEIAGRSRGTPRVANMLLRRVRDYSQVAGHERIDHASANLALTAFGVDAVGLDRVARRILEQVAVAFRGGPVGLSTLAAAVGEAEVTVEQVYEPQLMREGFLARTPRGRVATQSAYDHLGVAAPEREGTLFGQL